jgi:hypothetical protein
MGGVARPLLLLAVALVALGGCTRGGEGPQAASAAGASPSMRDRFARKIGAARGVAYAAEVSPGIYRGGVPDKEGVAWLKTIGVRTVINLRHFHGETEGERVRTAGMGYERIELASSDEPEPTQVDRFLTLIRDQSLRPVYVHCLHGVDRTGVMMAVYRMEVEGWSNADAVAEMESFGPHAIWRDLQRFVRQYRPRAVGGERR